MHLLLFFRAVLLSLADDNGVIAIHRFCEMIDVSAAKNYRVGEVCEKVNAAGFLKSATSLSRIYCMF